MINDASMEKAIKYLGETDEQAARLKANVERLDKIEKTVLGQVFLSSTGTNQEKEYKARTSDSYKQWQDEKNDAVLDFEIVKNKRIRAELTIEIWRSLNANRRRGNI